MNTTDRQNSVPCDKQRLLIVDDESGIRNVFSKVLTCGLPHCRIDLAVNGAEAVDSFRTIHHGLLLMDLNMPVMDGEQAFYKIQEICEKEGWEMPAVVFCTGYNPSENVRKIVANSRIHCILHKPVSCDVLLEALRIRLPEKG
jgi:CheY-like chemotaxis protein